MAKRFIGDPLARFMQKVRQGDGCWHWTATKTHGGYGIFYYEGRTQVAHRASYKMFVGPIPEGLTLDHLCRNRGCVNPFHLEPVTLAENILRGESPAAQCARKTHCVHGHEYTEQNTYWRTNGARACKTCKARWESERSERRRLLSLA